MNLSGIIESLLIPLAVFLPLLSFLLVGALSRHLRGETAGYISSLMMTVAAGASVVVFISVGIDGDVHHVVLAPWFNIGQFSASWSLYVDTLTAVMLVVVNVVSMVVHWYSVGYMHDDRGQNRFMALLGLFTFAMLMLVTADNLVQLFFGWEGVGLASYLLIGFWHEKASANRAAIKAFVVNRVGDFGFALGIFALYLMTGSVEFDAIFAAIPSLLDQQLVVMGVAFDAVTLACLLLFLGAMGKSAQFGLHVWLPDAMEGPTPVSALIHAATMVTAGVFMLARLSPVFEYSQFALDVVTVVGALTAVFAASVAMVQNDIKRIIAYSTCSQLGYMFFALGVSAYEAAVFHLFTHAFFKAMLFLGAGSVIHALHHEQDIRKMGGLYRLMPLTYIMMVVGSLSLIGLPLFSGMYSKDMILEAAYATPTLVGQIAFTAGIVAAFMTAVYSTRLLMMVFHGKARASQQTMKHVHEAPWIMNAPMLILLAGTMMAGYLGYGHFVGHEAAMFWKQALFTLPHHAANIANAHHLPFEIKALPIVIGFIGVFIGWLFYKAIPRLAPMLAQSMGGVYRLLLNKWYVDELYQVVIVKPLVWLARGLWQFGDVRGIDRVIPHGAATIVRGVALMLARVQTGYVYHYALVMIAAVAFLFFMVIMGRG